MTDAERLQAHLAEAEHAISTAAQLIHYLHTTTMASVGDLSKSIASLHRAQSAIDEIRQQRPTGSSDPRRI